jgi:hypothetical protein
MSQITIQCRLFADETARQYLWQLMAERNTPLVNELLRQVALHPEFATWRSKGKLPSAEVTKFTKSLKTDLRFSNQPAKFAISAEKTAIYTLNSWLAIQKRTQHRLEGKISWLRMLRTDEELVSDCERDLVAIRKKALQILSRTGSAVDDAEAKRDFHKQLYRDYDKAKDTLTQGAIAYLLKNHCQMPTEDEEDTTKLLKYRRKIENQIRRLTQQLENRLPQGRDLTGERWLQTLKTATEYEPIDNAEVSRWQSQLFKKVDRVPFPIVLESNMDLMWFLTSAGKIGLHIGGLSEHEFTIGCDRRHLHYFQKFLSDYQTMLANNRQLTSSLFLLRSAKLIWVPKEDKGEPWNIHHLHLSCTLDTRLLTTEGTELVRQEVGATTAQKLATMREKTERTSTQDNYIKRLQSTVDKLGRSFDRPSKPIYQGRSHITVAVSMGLKNPVSAIVFDLQTQQVLAYRNIKQLLGENYHLHERQRSLQTQQRHQRHNAQKQGLSRQFSNSNLGEYLDRLFAQAIIELAKTYRAGSLVLPKLDNINSIVQSEIDAMAQAKIPDCIEAQKKYAKKARINLHQWSYSRLSQAIINKANRSQIALEYGKQLTRGSPLQQAQAMVISAYSDRQI